MYEPEHKSKMFLFIVAVIASLIGWGFLTFYKPLVIEAGCSEVAAGTSSILGRNNYNIDSYFSYDQIKYECIKDSRK